MSQKHDACIAWADKHADYELPLFDAVFAPPPSYTWKTIKEPIEPFHALFAQVDALLTAIRGDVDEDYWDPNPNYYALEQIRDDLQVLAFRDVPNPEYDEERAEAWHRAHPGRRPYFSQKITIGQSYHPTVADDAQLWVDDKNVQVISEREDS